MRKFLACFGNKVLKKPVYSLPLLFYGLVAYLSSFTQNVTQFEEFQTEYYLGSGKAVLSGRWGQYLWVHLASVLMPNSILTKFMAFLLFLLAVILLAAVFFCLDQTISPLRLMLFSTATLTYPLIHEVWDYRVNLMVAGNLAATAFSILILLVYGFHWKSILLTGLLMTVPASSYESCLFCYVLLIGCIFFYRDLQGGIRAKDYLKEGILFLLSLVVAVVLRLIVTVFNLKVFDLSFVAGGAITPEWVHGRFPAGAMLRDTFHDYFLKGLVYFPITIFAAFAILFLIFIVASTVQKRRLSLLVTGLLVLIFCFLQGIVQLLSMPYRTAQPMSFFVGFTLLLLSGVIESFKPVWLRVACVIAALFLIYRQSVYLNEIFLLDAQVAENDAAMVRSIGYRLMTEFEEKEVYFYNTSQDRELYAQWNGIIGKEIKKEISYDPDTATGRAYKELYQKLYDGEEPPEVLIQSDLFSTLQLLSSPWGISYYFSYYGFDLHTVTGKDYKSRSEAIIAEQGLRRYDIYDAGDFILVCLE